MVKSPLAVQETWVQPLGREDTLQEGMTAHPGILAWRTPWTEEPGGLWSHWSRIELDKTERLTDARTHTVASRSTCSKRWLQRSLLEQRFTICEVVSGLVVGSVTLFWFSRRLSYMQWSLGGISTKNHHFSRTVINFKNHFSENEVETFETRGQSWDLGTFHSYLLTGLLTCLEYSSTSLWACCAQWMSKAASSLTPPGGPCHHLDSSW